MDRLQFRKAEFAVHRRECALCRGEIERMYFHLNGQAICPACAGSAQARQRRPSHVAVLRGLVYGGGMAVLCSIGYAIFTMVTNMEVALIAIAIGFLIGRAVRTGSRGLGGRRCQALAVLLTYFAIIMGYLPPVVKQMRETTAKVAEKGAEVRTASLARSAQPPAPKPSLARWLIAVGVIGIGVAFVAIAAPVAVLTSGASGIISVLILLLGLQRAWRETARDARVLMGPYELEEAPAIA